MTGPVVVIKIAAMGDFLMATPAFKALAATGRRVIAVVGRSIEPVARRNPDIAELIVADDRAIFHGSSLRKGREVLRLAREIRRHRPEFGINFHRDWRYSVILALAGVPVRIGFANRGDRLLNRPVAVEGIAHHVFQYARLSMAAGAVPASYRLVFPLSAAERQAAKDRLPERPDVTDGRWVALAPGGAANVKETMASRRWPAQEFAELARCLERRGLGVVVVGGAGDASLGRTIVAASPAAVDLCGQTSVAEAAAILANSALAVSNDSGLMHLAAATGIPVVALFGPTHPAEKRPLTEGSVVLWKGETMDCAPCYTDGVFPDCREVSCLRSISPAEVEEAALKALGSAPAMV